MAPAKCDIIQPDSAQVIAPPPLISFGTLGVGVIAHFIWQPFQLFPHTWIGHAAGWPVLVVGLLIFFWSVRTMRGAGEDVRVGKPTHAIVSHGPFSYSRNPIYVSMTLGYVGISLILDTFWPLTLLPGVLFIMHYGVIKREEHYLAKLFGNDYVKYQAQVRRWW